MGNTARLLTLAALEKKSESIFGLTPTTEEAVAAVETAKIIGHETDPILKKRVIGKDDVGIAAMIKKLGNSDWVREGRTVYDENGSIFPFRQQSTTEAVTQSLNEYFDETFVTDSKVIDDLATNNSTDAARLQQQIASIIASPSRFLDVETAVSCLRTLERADPWGRVDSLRKGRQELQHQTLTTFWIHAHTRADPS